MNNNEFKKNITQSTPSVPQYFSWINSTNEGSTEAQTITNLEFFAWLKKVYGMEIKIYAWDAGNFDGCAGTYGDADGEKFKAQYPNGYDNVVKKAAESGIRMGLWAGPDGYGDTPESEEKRYNFMVDLCKKHNFALFKLDGVCGILRPEKAKKFAEQLKKCQEYCPDLIVLNHRLDLYEAERYATTSLWNGDETYVDVHFHNYSTCMHHRGFIFERGMPENLDRLLEDHGVCISSSVAYFEDDLIYQAFGRCMILAPEIYGNPWLIRDDEYPKLARIYNLHKACAPILVNGLILPQSYGDSPVSRGNGKHRFITTGNNSWTSRNISVKLNDEIGLENSNERIAVIQRHPSEKLIGIYNYGDTVDLELTPFRAVLLEVATLSEAFPVLVNCEYEMVIEDKSGIPLEVKMLKCDGGEIHLLIGGEERIYGNYEGCDIRPFAPKYLGKLISCEDDADRYEELYEAAQFSVDNDSLERRELRRSGETKIPEVQAARDAFFNQASYKARGCDGEAAFDGNPNTFFDGQSKTFCAHSVGHPRIGDGCLRVDFGDIYDADEIEITCFSIYEPIDEISAQNYTDHGTFSSDFKKWYQTSSAEISAVEANITTNVVRYRDNSMACVNGDRMSVRYALDGKPVRYFRLPNPMDRIYSIRLIKDGREVALSNPKVNNLQAPYGSKMLIGERKLELTLPDNLNDGDYISVALNGTHGEEGAYCVAEIDGILVGSPERAPAYRSNVWEFLVRRVSSNYTYYLPLKKSMSGKNIKIRVLLCDENNTDFNCDAWLCPAH